MVLKTVWKGDEESPVTGTELFKLSHLNAGEILSRQILALLMANLGLSPCSTYGLLHHASSKP